MFSMTTDICCICISLIGIFVIALWGKTLGRTGHYALYVYEAHILQLVSNLLGLTFKGYDGNVIYVVLRITNFCEFASGYLVSALFILYIIQYVENEEELKKWEKKIEIALLVAVGLLIVSQFNGMYYTINEENLYQRGSMYPLSLAFSFWALIVSAYILVRYRKKLDRRLYLPIICYLLIPVVGMLLQIMFYGINLILLLDTMVLVLMFLIMHMVQTQDYYERERDLQEMKVNIMISQMQPHFLYNSLTVIDQLCKTDVDMARKALASFSTYLRGNLNSLKRKGMIAFSEERKHIEAYLTLEQLRFGELLCVEYDIEVEDFLLPVLSVQPLVENAVKHGLGDSEDGGKVIIATREEKDRYVVTVTDDGVGFEPGEVKGNGEHIGIENIRKRLALVCGGELIIRSEVGRGTKATVIISKESIGGNENTGG